MDREHWNEVFHERQVMLDLFRRLLLREPEREYLDLCRSLQVFEALAESSEFAGTTAGAVRIRDFLVNEYGKKEEAFDRLHWDYTRMFLGPKPPTAPLWASYYLEKDHLLFQTITSEARCMYRKYHLIAGERVNSEADDHFGMELDFLYQMNEKVLNAGDDDVSLVKTWVSDQKWLLDHHLCPALPQWCELVQKEEEVGFYGGLAQMLTDYAEQDQKRLEKFLK